MRHPLRATTRTLIVMTILAVGFAGGSLFGGDKDPERHVILEKYANAGAERPWLGVYLGEIEIHGQERRDDTGRGIRILSVIDDSPAQKAGIEDGDLIIMFNGVNIEDEDDFYREFRNLKPDDAVDVVVLRDGDEENLEVILGRRADRSILRKEIRIPPIHMPEMRMRGYIGVNLQDMTDELREYFDVPEGEGVLVSKVEKDSPAENAGLRAGDILTEANGDVIKNSGDLIKALRDKKGGDPLDITFYRDGRRDTVTITLDETESHVMDVNSFIWCEGEGDCEATFDIDSDSGFIFDNGAFQKSMHELTEYFNSEDFQRMIQDYSRTYESMEREMEKKMKELERKLQELEERLQEMREEEEASRYRMEDTQPERFRTTGQI